ncbi:hypothetical protein [Pseudomonas sp. TMB3-21]
MIEALKKHRHWIGLLLLVVAIGAGFIRFDGSWKRFFSMVLLQLWFARAVYNYLCGGWVGLGLGGMGPSGDPKIRAGTAAFALLLYFTVFFLF